LHALVSNEPGEKLLRAVLDEDRKTMELLLAEDPELIHYKDSDGYTGWIFQYLSDFH